MKNKDTERAVGLSFLTVQTFALTAFGMIVLAHDPSLFTNSLMVAGEATGILATSVLGAAARRALKKP